MEPFKYEYPLGLLNSKIPPLCILSLGVFLHTFFNTVNSLERIHTWVIESFMQSESAMLRYNNI